MQGLFSSKYVTEYLGRADLKQLIQDQVGNGVHQYGTTVTIKTPARTGYFCALADINSSGVAQSSIENIRVALSGLWDYLGKNGEKEIINTPILGSGFSRVSASREKLCKEIIRSFIASTTQYTFCDGLRIVIHPKDIKDNKIDLGELAKFLEYSCKYSLVESAY